MAIDGRRINVYLRSIYSQHKEHGVSGGSLISEKTLSDDIPPRSDRSQSDDVSASTLNMTRTMNTLKNGTHFFIIFELISSPFNFTALQPSEYAKSTFLPAPKAS
jgi:hypothetical protein